MKMNMCLKISPTAAAILLLSMSSGLAETVKVRLGTLAPKGSSYTKHLQSMGDQWRQAPGGGVQLTVFPDGTMGSEEFSVTPEIGIHRLMNRGM